MCIKIYHIKGFQATKKISYLLTFFTRLNLDNL